MLWQQQVEADSLPIASAHCRSPGEMGCCEATVRLLCDLELRTSFRGKAADAARARELRPDIALGADLIAGFPTESEAMFSNTLAAVEECGLTWLHVFPYSARSGTPAAKMPQVPAPVRKERAGRLREAGRAAVGRYLDAQLGGDQMILVEQPFMEVVLDARSQPHRGRHRQSTQPPAPGRRVELVHQQWNRLRIHFRHHLARAAAHLLFEHVVGSHEPLEAEFSQTLSRRRADDCMWTI